jgi:PAS domain S-box-containing protein
MTQPIGEKKHLRAEAEDTIQAQNAGGFARDEAIPPSEARRLLHELRVHQVELESQNDELRRTQLELEAAKSRYFELYDLAPIGYLTISEAGAILEGNLTGAQLLGTEKKQLLKKPFVAFICPEDQDQYYLLCRKRILNDVQHVCELRLKGGEVGFFWARLEFRPMLGIDGKRIYFTAISDVTDRVTMAEALKQSESRLASIVTDQTELICRYLPGGLITFVNDAYLRYFGKKRQDLLKHNFIPHIPQPDMDMIKARLKKISPEKPLADFEHRVIMPNGSVRWQHWIHRGIFSLWGELTEYQAVGRDITDRKNAASAREEIERLQRHSLKLAGLTRMAGGVAHDFNNILTIMRLNLEMAMTQVPVVEPGCLKHLQAIDSAVERASVLSQKMLAYSGHGRYTCEALSLNDLVRDGIGQTPLLSAEMEPVSLKLATDLPLVSVDGEQIRQVVAQLITNAVEALKDNCGAIEVSTSLMDCSEDFLRSAHREAPGTPGRYVALEVRDTGCGMDEEIQARLFDPFFTTKFVGRGLGLSAVLGIVRSHQGTIMVKSQKDHGTSVTVFLPIHVPNPCDAQPADQVTTTTGVLAPGVAGADVRQNRVFGTVLVVDDENLIRELCSTSLRKMGFQVLLASDGQEAIDLYTQHAAAIRCVLLDLSMPRVDGWAAFSAIRALNPDACIILSSGYAEEEAQSRFIDDKPDCFLQKPYHFCQLAEMIAGVMEKKATQVAERMCHGENPRAGN